MAPSRPQDQVPCESFDPIQGDVHPDVVPREVQCGDSTALLGGMMEAEPVSQADVTVAAEAPAP